MLIRKVVHTSSLSHFVRYEKADKKKRIYTAALDAAKQEQLEVIKEAERLAASS